jgi:hypothetical protein
VSAALQATTTHDPERSSERRARCFIAILMTATWAFETSNPACPCSRTEGLNRDRKIPNHVAESGESAISKPI